MSNIRPELPQLPEQLPPVPPQPPHVDRSTGLTVFGIIEILLAALALLMVPLMLLGLAFSLRQNGLSVAPGSFLLGPLTYTAIAAVLITLGFGSISARRWARALNLILGWLWLVTGFVITVFMTALLPAGFSQGMRQALARNPNAPAMPAGAIAVGLTVVIVVMAVIFIGLPLAFVLFYGSRNVEETCRHRDPVTRWTDRVPLPLLAACMIFASSAAYFVGMSFTTPLIPFFGKYFTGIAGAAACLVLAAVDVFVAVAFYRLRIAGWWVAVLFEAVRIISTTITLQRGNLYQAFSRMGLGQTQLQMLGNNPFFKAGLYWSVFAMLIFFCYLLWIRRYFGREAPRAAMPADVVAGAT